MAEGKSQIRIDASKAIPIFADEAMVITRIKTKKEDEKSKKTISKEGHLELLFLDQLSNPPRVISRVVLSKTTGENLHKVLGNNLEKLGIELKSKKMPKQQKKVEPKKAEKGYFG